MNKYIYKVRFVTSYNKNTCINMNSFLAQKNRLETNSLRSMNASRLFSQQFHFLNSDR